MLPFGQVAEHVKRNSEALSAPSMVVRLVGPLKDTALVMAGSAVRIVMVCPPCAVRSMTFAAAALALASWIAARSVQVALGGGAPVPQAPSPFTVSGVSAVLFTAIVSAAAG